MFGLGNFSAAGAQSFPGLAVNDSVIDLRSHLGPGTTTKALVEDWDASLERLRDIAQAGASEARPLNDLRPLPPVQPFGQIFCAGANYRRHVSQIMFTTARNQLGETRSEEVLQAEADDFVQVHANSGSPFVFSVQPSAFSGARDDVILWGPGVQHDWELELAAVIAKGGMHIAPENAMDHVAGYTISNDISTRDVMDRENFNLSDFLMTKGRPTFFPTGPYLVPKEYVPNYRDLRITLRVNGEVMQNEGVDDIMYGVEELVAYISTVTELLPGDIILTGSPAGNAGHHENRWLRPGDVMEGEITGLGVQRNVCVADPRG